jgi:hypothetical protein
MTEVPANKKVNQQDKRFCFVFLISCLGSFGVIFLVNYIANPYGDYATKFFRPLVQTARNDKVYLLSQLKEVPAGVVIGSSRVMRMEPDYLKSVFGYDFFNFGVNSAMPEDHLAILRYYEKCCGKPPEMVILGIDIYSFTDALPMDSRLANCPELLGNLPELQGNSLQQWKARFSRNRKLFRENFKFYMLNDSVRSLKMEMWDGGKEESTNEFLANGMMVDRLTKKENTDGVFDLAQGIEIQKTDYARRYAGFDSLSKRRCQYFETFLKHCNENEIKLVVFLTPLHPELVSDLAEKTTFTQRKKELITYLNTQCLKNQTRFYDFSKIESFQGLADDFHDGVHATVVNNRRIINCMIPRISDNKQNAF